MVARRGRPSSPDNFAPLNAFYVMVALGRARKLKKTEGRAMVFQVRLVGLIRQLAWHRYCRRSATILHSGRLLGISSEGTRTKLAVTPLSKAPMSGTVPRSQTHLAAVSSTAPCARDGRKILYVRDSNATWQA